MREALELLIEDYLRRMQSCHDLMIETTDKDQYNRCSVKYQVYGDIVRDLKGVLANEADNTDRADGRGPHDPKREI